MLATEEEFIAPFDDPEGKYGTTARVCSTIVKDTTSHDSEPDTGPLEVLLSGTFLTGDILVISCIPDGYPVSHFLFKIVYFPTSREEPGSR